MSLLSQKTVGKKIIIPGIGIHTGRKVELNILPSAPNSGIIFKRIDLKKNNTVFPNFANVCDATLCTTISNQFGVKVSTIEHLMAAFYGEGVDNVLVEIDAPEIPIMDGSAFDFVEAIRSVGTEKQKHFRKFIKAINKLIGLASDALLVFQGIKNVFCSSCFDASSIGDKDIGGPHLFFISSSNVLL